MRNKIDDYKINSKKANVYLFYLIFATLIINCITLYSIISLKSNFLDWWFVAVWGIYLLVFILFLKSIGNIFGYFDLRLAPLYCVGITVYLRISFIIIPLIKKGSIVHSKLFTLEVDSFSFILGLGFITFGVLFYIIGSFGLGYTKFFFMLRKKLENLNSKFFLSDRGILIFLLSLSLLFLGIYFLIIFNIFQGNLSNLIHAINSDIYRIEMTKNLPESLITIPYLLSIGFGACTLLFYSESNQKFVVTIVFFLAVVQSVLMLPLGNKQTIATPLVIWFILIFLRRKISLRKIIVITMIIFVLLLTIFYISFGSQQNPRFISIVNSFKELNDEFIMFDVFAVMSKAVLLNKLNYKYGEDYTKLTYFLPSFMLENEKPNPPDFELSLELELAKKQAFGVSPTVFGGLLWNFGAVGILVGSFLFGVLTFFLSWLFSQLLLSLKFREGIYLFYTILFLFLMDLTRVGGLLRESLTLFLYLFSIVVVSLTVNIFLIFQFLMRKSFINKKE